MFSYASVETQVLGLVLRSVVGRPVAEYLRDKIWEPIGAEADATWIIDASGQEATLLLPQRGAARLRAARFAARARRSARRPTDHPEGVDAAATTIAPNDWHLKRVWDRTGFGYGYQTWIFPASAACSP